MNTHIINYVFLINEHEKVNVSITTGSYEIEKNWTELKINIYRQAITYYLEEHEGSHIKKISILKEEVTPIQRY